MIYALAATSLNLVLGYGGMVSLRPRRVLRRRRLRASRSYQRGRAAAPDRLAACGRDQRARAALVIGAISLRTRGVYFIMITLAFAQMMYYLFVSLKAYGGDDGLNLAARSRSASVSICSDDTTFYYVVLAILAGCLYLLGALSPPRASGA